MQTTFMVEQGQARLTNEEIVNGAYACLECHPHFRGRTNLLQICCSRSVLTVKGRLPSFYLKQVLQTALHKLEGVATIQNEVCVTNPGEF